MTDKTGSPKAQKIRAVRITFELPVSFIRLLDAKVQMQGWHNTALGDGKEMDPAGILALLALMEARGAPEDQIHASTPLMWRTAGGPELVHNERRVLFEE
jgi:hypothetical protein